jgi:ribonuclease Z
MQKFGIRWRKLHHILISHLHGDHYFGLPGLLNSMSLQGRTQPLNLYAPAQLKPILDMIMQVADSELAYPLHFHPLPEGAALLAENSLFSIKCFPVIHRIACHGFVIETAVNSRKLLIDQCEQYHIPQAFFNKLKQGEDYIGQDGSVIANTVVTDDPPPSKKYAYCADTLYSEDYLPYIMGVDMLYHESTYLHEHADKAVLRFHSTAVQAAEMGKRAHAGQLLIGHFSSKYHELDAFAAEAGAIFPGVHVTVEGTSYEV